MKSFQNGYTFSGMDVSDTNAKDEEGNTLDNYKEISIKYEKAGETGLSMYAMEAIHDHETDKRSADKTVGINGAQVKYYVDTYKWVPADYEVTPEDEANMERGDYFISYGADAVSENQVSYVIWIQDGIRYCIMNVHNASSPEELFQMAKEIIVYLSCSPPTIFCIHTLLLIIKKPITTLMISVNCIRKNTAVIGSVVCRARKEAKGIISTQVYTLSNKKVMIVLPPERRVK